VLPSHNQDVLPAPKNHGAHLGPRNVCCALQACNKSVYIHRLSQQRTAKNASTKQHFCVQSQFLCSSREDAAAAAAAAAPKRLYIHASEIRERRAAVVGVHLSCK